MVWGSLLVLSSLRLKGCVVKMRSYFPLPYFYRGVPGGLDLHDPSFLEEGQILAEHFIEFEREFVFHFFLPEFEHVISNYNI